MTSAIIPFYLTHGQFIYVASDNGWFIRLRHIITQQTETSAQNA